MEKKPIVVGRGGILVVTRNGLISTRHFRATFCATIQNAVVFNDESVASMSCCGVLCCNFGA